MICWWIHAKSSRVISYSGTKSQGTTQWCLKINSKKTLLAPLTASSTPKLIQAWTTNLRNQGLRKSSLTMIRSTCSKWLVNLRLTSSSKRIKINTKVRLWSCQLNTKSWATKHHSWGLSSKRRSTILKARRSLSDLSQEYLNRRNHHTLTQWITQISQKVLGDLVLLLEVLLLPDKAMEWLWVLLLNLLVLGDLVLLLEVRWLVLLLAMTV